MRKSFVAGALAWAILLGDCVGTETVGATEVVVVIYSDKALESRLATVTAEVFDERGKNSSAMHSFEIGTETMLPISFGVHQPRGGDEWFLLVASGLDPQGTKLVEYKIIAHFAEGKTGLLQVFLGEACVGNFCTDQPEQTCDARTGACVDVQRVMPPELGDADASLASWFDDGGAGIGPGVGDPDAGLVSVEPDAGATQVDAGIETSTAPVPASRTGFSTFGGRRTDGSIVVSDDGFEQGARLCTADGQYCVTGSFQP